MELNEKINVLSELLSHKKYIMDENSYSRNASITYHTSGVNSHTGYYSYNIIYPDPYDVYLTKQIKQICGSILKNKDYHIYLNHIKEFCKELLKTNDYDNSIIVVNILYKETDNLRKLKNKSEYRKDVHLHYKRWRK